MFNSSNIVKISLFKDKNKEQNCLLENKKETKTMRRTKQNHGIFADMICPKMQNFLFILQIMFLLHKSNIISFPNGLATVVGKRIQLHTHLVVLYPNVHSSFLMNFLLRKVRHILSF